MTGHDRRRYRFTKRTHYNQELGSFIALLDILQSSYQRIQTLKYLIPDDQSKHEMHWHIRQSLYRVITVSGTCSMHQACVKAVLLVVTFLRVNVMVKSVFHHYGTEADVDGLHGLHNLCQNDLCHKGSIG
jgi:hypothetical protein